MYNENTILRGKKVTVIPLQQSNLNSYLLVYKKASAFAEMYEKYDDLWNATRKDVENDYIQARNRRFLIYKIVCQNPLVILILLLAIQDKQK